MDIGAARPDPAAHQNTPDHPGDRGGGGQHGDFPVAGRGHPQGVQRRTRRHRPRRAGVAQRLYPGLCAAAQLAAEHRGRHREARAASWASRGSRRSSCRCAAASIPRRVRCSTACLPSRASTRCSRTWRVAQGRLLRAGDSGVAVVGAKASTNLKLTLGSTLRLNRRSAVKVVGMLAQVGRPQRLVYLHAARHHAGRRGRAKPRLDGGGQAQRSQAGPRVADQPCPSRSTSKPRPRAIS